MQVTLQECYHSVLHVLTLQNLTKLIYIRTLITKFTEEKLMFKLSTLLTLHLLTDWGGPT